jgi:hypothetical protein
VDISEDKETTKQNELISIIRKNKGLKSHLAKLEECLARAD